MGIKLINKTTGEEFLVPENKKKITIGRAVEGGPVNDINIPNSYSSRHISRKHCDLYRKGDELVVIDGESMNGVYINGEPVSKGLRVVLNNGIRLGLGSHYELEVRIGGEDLESLEPEGGSTEFEIKA